MKLRKNNIKLSQFTIERSDGAVFDIKETDGYATRFRFWEGDKHGEGIAPNIFVKKYIHRFIEKEFAND